MDTTITRIKGFRIDDAREPASALSYYRTHEDGAVTISETMRDAGIVTHHENRLDGVVLTTHTGTKIIGAPSLRSACAIAQKKGLTHAVRLLSQLTIGERLQAERGALTT